MATQSTRRSSISGRSGFCAFGVGCLRCQFRQTPHDFSVHGGRERILVKTVRGIPAAHHIGGRRSTLVGAVLLPDHFSVDNLSFRQCRAYGGGLL